MDIFSLFCAPSLVCYLPFHDGAPGSLVVTPEGGLLPEKTAEAMLCLDQPLVQWGNAGFMACIRRDVQMFGVVMVDGIAMQERIGEYLNLALILLPVMALALANVRIMERERQRTEQLGVANQELDAFAYAVSHDLRAPLRAVTGFSQALVEECGEGLNEEAHLYLRQITIASQQMTELIDGLLTLSRCTRGELRRDRTDLSLCAGQICATLAGMEPERIVKWEIEPGIVVHGDARMLEAVMNNLMHNAWKFTSATVAPCIRIYGEERNGRLFVCVSDNGAGFDMRYAKQLFKPFQRLHRQDEFPGIGIGLATVQRIINRHGGEIMAEAEQGKGATFCFSLPENGACP